MPSASILKRQQVFLRPNPARLILLPFKPATEPHEFNPTDMTRANHIIDLVMAMGTAVAQQLLDGVLADFAGRHHNLVAQFEARADEMASITGGHGGRSTVQRQLIGAYFLREYSYEATALLNSSIVHHPDQTDAPPGGLRFLLSLRAIGEGHISSLTFRVGSIAQDGAVTVDPPGPLAVLPTVTKRTADAEGEGDDVEVEFRADIGVGSRVIFPVTVSQSNGIEDARFVAFVDGGVTTYYATYTAYSGRAIRSELIETHDFLKFRMSPMHGTATHNKGIALFPRKLGGRFAAIGRQDNENLFLIYSDNLREWNGGVPILKPEFPWEFVQLGNCGSPIELDAGWLLVTHGVGPMRKYSIGAVLLSKEDPSIVLGRTSLPLVQAEPFEREGYVPNVVYTCGALLHNNLIILPYAVADTFSNFATIGVRDLLQAMRA